MKQENKRGEKPKLRFPKFRDAPEWEQKQLMEVLDYERPDKYIVADTNYQQSGIPVLTANKSFILGYTHEEQGVFIDTPVIIFDDFTVDKKYVDFSFKIKSSAIKILKIKDNNNLKFIYEVMNQIKFEATAHKRYYISAYQNLLVKIPKPDEQQKIADCLSSIDGLIAAQSQKLDTLKAHKKGLLQQLFPAEGETMPQLRFPEFKDAPEWEEKRFGNLLKISSGKGFKASEYSKIGIRLLQIENVGYGTIKWNENTNYLPEIYAQKYPELVLRENDIVLALNRPITNNELKIAKLKNNDEPSVLYQRVGRVERISDLITDNFVFHVCEIFVKNFVINQSIGSDQPFISLRELYLSFR